MNIKTITPQELQELHQQGSRIDLLDVRTPVEFREFHATFARNAPLDSLEPHTIMKERNATAEEPLYLICRSGDRASKAFEQFAAAGYTNVVIVEGGTIAWVKAGQPVIRGKKSISLERQVRIAAGSLVFLGAILGFFVHLYFIWLSAFVGAGLAIAGVSDTCGMGMMLAKMPWNRCDTISCTVK